MNIEHILSKIPNQEEISLILKVYNILISKISFLSEENKKYYLNQVLSVINILVEFKAYSSIIISYLLSLIPPNEQYDLEISPLINNIANKVTYLKTLEKTAQEEYEQALLELTTNEIDFRVFFIIFAEKYWQLINLSTAPVSCQKSLANYILNTYVPLASKINLNFFKSKVEDLCLFYLEPEIYKSIMNKLNADPLTLKYYLNSMMNSIATILTKNNIAFAIKGRVKNIYSLYLKLARGKSFAEIYDIIAIRIIVDDIQTCYEIVELLKTNYTHNPARFKDYIKNPKQNSYQSLHMALTDANNHLYEIQIRTKTMNQIAEIGSASHHTYKEYQRKKNIESSKNYDK